MNSASFNPRASANLIYIGVAIASGGVALYTPIIVSETGLAYSGFWAASILFGLNLGRLIGSWAGTRFPAISDHPYSVTANILAEGLALYCMAYLKQAWALALFAFLAGLGSGMSFPGLKNYLLKLRDLDKTSLFSGLAMAIRLGVVVGYLAASWIPHQQLQLVFTIVFATFVIYGLFMLKAMRQISAHQQAQLEQSRQTLTPPSKVAPAKKLPLLFLLSNAVFWCFAVQPMIGYSLHIPKYTPEIPVSTPFWISGLMIILLQLPLARLAKSPQQHMQFLTLGFICLCLSFSVMTLFGKSATVVVLSAILLSFGQIFYGPSLDFLLANFAEKSGSEPGPIMSGQMFYQALGNMLGSLCGGFLFDLAQHWKIDWLNWLILSLITLVMSVLSWHLIPQLYWRHLNSSARC